MFKQLSFISDGGVLILIDSNLFRQSVKEYFGVFDPASAIAFQNKTEENLSKLKIKS